MATKSKHIQQRQQHAEYIKQQVIQLLQWAETADYSEYSVFQQKAGLDYLNYLLDGDALGVEYLERRTHFWAWWRNKWTERDEAFVKHCNGLLASVKLDTLIELYHMVHEASELSKHEMPHSVVFGKGFYKLHKTAREKEWMCIDEDGILQIQTPTPKGA